MKVALVFFDREGYVEKRLEHVARLAVIFIFVTGCFMVLRPFLTAALFAVVVCVSSWPVYLRLLHWVYGRKNLAALIMSFLISFLFIFPLALVAYNLADGVTHIYDEIRLMIENGQIVPPSWLKKIPIIGGPAHNYWQLVARSKPDMDALTTRLLGPAKDLLLAGSILLGQGVMVMSMAVFVSFFLFRDGLSLLHFFNLALDRIAGIHKENLLQIVKVTIRSVMFGLLGTALAQGLLATVGFAIAGVPAAIMLGVVTALLSLLPIGPPLVWIGASVWLFYQGAIGWGVFMLIWGLFLISSIDNVLKPSLISRGSNLPFVLVLLGAMGGVVAFGFVGIFLGPTLLAVAFSLLREWSVRHQES